MGRPAKINKDRTANICSHIREGASIEAACELEGITRQTYYNWMDRAEEALEKPPEERTEMEETYVRFFYMAMRARNEREKKLAGTIYEAATEGGEWRAAAWLLERMYPERYSKKQIVERADPPKPIGWADEEVEEIDYEVVQQDPDAN